ncbi:MAG: hypothetical protein QY309_07985 [Cyclobacteriaceae bacterium]|nr:MAG: hypothetical protein QY309_07985 [Cyclobacteriaceae bacterium]
MNPLNSESPCKSLQGLIHDIHESSLSQEVTFTEQRRKLKIRLEDFLLKSMLWKSHGVQMKFSFFDNEANYIDQMLQSKANSFGYFIINLQKTNNPELINQALTEIDEERCLYRKLIISREGLNKILLHITQNA